MREIKFRAWDKENKDMINIARIDISDGTSREFILEGKFLDYWNDVILMQYTGMKDNNNEEIYEGDIVEFLDSEQVHCMSYEHEEFWNKGQVIWDSGKLGFDITNRIDVDEDDVWHDIKVIGNIYENPDLLKN